MPIHVNVIDKLTVYHFFIFKPDGKYGDDYEGTMLAVVRDDFVEVTGMKAELSAPRTQIMELVKKLREIKSAHGLPVLARRVGVHGKPPGFKTHVCGEWWELE